MKTTTEGTKHQQTITRTVETQLKHAKIFPGGGEFAIVKIRLEPLTLGAGIQFVRDLPPGTIPDQFIGGVEEGIREAAKEGVLEGGPVVDFKATLVGGAYHELDSNWRTFSLAARGAFQDAVKNAGRKPI